MTLENALQIIRQKDNQNYLNKMKQEQYKDYYIFLLQKINYNKKVIAEKKKNKEDFSVFQYWLDCWNKQLERYKKFYFSGKLG